MTKHPAAKLRILGIDPGSNVVGFAIIESRAGQSFRPQDFRILDAGALRVKSRLSLAERIGELHETLYSLVKEWSPGVCAIEKAFVGVNINSALRLGEARGALISAMRRLDVAVAELTPTEVKKTVTGHGHATKEQVALALKMLLQFERGKLPLDVSDALAVALCYGLGYGFSRLLAKNGVGHGYGKVPLGKNAPPAYR